MLKLLDLFCGAGGAAMGYYRAGFELITGVDLEPMPRYPFEFRQADALQFLEQHGHEYDFIHASPPCQKFVTLQSMNRKNGKNVAHPDLIEPTRQALQRSGKPYVIENVIGAPLLTQAILCGHYLGLKNLARHRCFESNLVIFGTPCTHRKSERIIGVYGDRPDGRAVVAKKEYRTTRVARGLAEASQAMGIDWMTWDEIRQAIPPAYTEYLGKQLIGQLEGNEAKIR
jgi:DNA (cytosine-5)-methyltransferase 1